MLVRRSAKFRGNSWRKSCEESRRKGAAARPSGTRFGKLRLSGGLYLRRAGRGFCTLPHPCNEAAPPPLGARCRSQIGTYAPGPGFHSGESTCDTCAHRRAVASLRRWQEQSVVHKRPPNDPPIFEPTRRARSMSWQEDRRVLCSLRPAQLPPP